VSGAAIGGKGDLETKRTNAGGSYKCGGFLSNRFQLTIPASIDEGVDGAKTGFGIAKKNPSFLNK
jgi:hypothetical protein